MNILAQILATLQTTVGKSILLYVTGWILKLIPSFSDKAIPLATMVVNILSTILATMASAHAAPLPGMFMLAAVEPVAGPGFNPLLDVILPQFIADGAYNWPRNLWHWLSGRFKK